MSATSDESLPLRARATLSQAQARAGEAWARLQERGSSFGSHPLSELLEDKSSDLAAGDQAEVA